MYEARRRGLGTFPICQGRWACVREQKVPSAQVARELGIGASVVSRWVREAGGDIRKAFPGQGQQPAEQAEIERLKREIVKLKAEKDILKKAAAYFARESG